MMKALCSFLLPLSLIAGCAVQAGETQDDKAEKPGYAIDATVSPTSVKTGTDGKIEITITPEAPWVLKTSTPMKITLGASDGVKLDKTTLKASDIANPEAKAKVVGTALKAESAGQKTIRGDVSFFLCTDQICQRFQDKTEATFVVE